LLKTRTLLHAHLHRLNTLSDDLGKDKRYVVKKTPYLINEMINIEAHLVAMGHAGKLKNGPRLDTIENTMKLSPMIVQALWNTKSPLLQLPHITESHLRYFETKKHTIKSIRQFASMDNDSRRSMLRSITDEQYDDIINVLSIYPHVTMTVSFEVYDDEEIHKITTGAVVTLTVHLQRENMSSVFNKELSGSNTIDNEANEDQRDDKENQEKTNETSKATAAPSKVWSNKSDKKKRLKRKVNLHHQNQQINNPQHLWLIKVKQKNQVEMRIHQNMLMTLHQRYVNVMNNRKKKQIIAIMMMKIFQQQHPKNPEKIPIMMKIHFLKNFNNNNVNVKN